MSSTLSVRAKPKILEAGAEAGVEGGACAEVGAEAESGAEAPAGVGAKAKAGDGTRAGARQKLRLRL